MDNFQKGIDAILSIKDPITRKGMQDIMDKFYRNNSMPKGTKLTDIQRKELCSLWADYLLKGGK